MSVTCFQPSPLTLGTVQLGLPYGIANSTGMPDADAAFAILDAAWSGGITTLDTARAYGLAEERIGQWRAARPALEPRIVTKIPALPTADTAARQGFVREAIAASHALLGGRAIDLILTHRGEDLLDPAVVSILQDMQGKDIVRAFGASVYMPDVALKLLDEVPLSALQLPFSIVDRRAEEAGVLDRAAARGVTVFARSLFLQGALLLDAHKLPSHLASLRPVMLALKETAESWRMTWHELMIAVVRDTPGVDSAVIGVERVDQVAGHLEAMRCIRLTPGQCAELRTLTNGLSEDVIDPSRWPRS